MKCQIEPKSKMPLGAGKSSARCYMATIKTVPQELLEQLRREREKIAVELPELLDAAGNSTRPPRKTRSAGIYAEPFIVADNP